LRSLRAGTIMYRMGQLSVDGVRRLIGVSHDEMSDHDIRVALARLAVDKDPSVSAREAAQRVRRVVAAIDRLPDEPGKQG
jgi:hypothetical protein